MRTVVSSEQEAISEGVKGEVTRSFMPPPWPTRVCFIISTTQVVMVSGMRLTLTNFPSLTSYTFTFASAPAIQSHGWPVSMSLDQQHEQFAAFSCNHK